MEYCRLDMRTVYGHQGCSAHQYMVVAPFWDDVDITRFGNIYYRRVTAGTEFLKLQEIITITFNTTGFEIRELFVATYHKVAEFSGEYAEVS